MRSKVLPRPRELLLRDVAQRVGALEQILTGAQHAVGRVLRAGQPAQAVAGVVEVDRFAGLVPQATSDHLLAAPAHSAACCHAERL